ncbi:MAG: hypothetical protein COZ06_03060 [Armatimonadetes bacterium CG_4_10_14_3_um_filter_66_18]|nr:hypothetical protein [Armatimonadota bacterium]PIX37663.1 MAG: hypothetical protein COZ57_33190 [Armatimonadetes bacterium CG_4_8_14_3_um_filter_66_20]PIY52396.1 MAG: hypothetical protein COZ06_03060 [Armatimonadetes bacterium CG_4_10_14_3_um_filter_66_18]PIZ29434.1 MAG: hypothetical protein COY42_35490 [Armatimonadetes bacterium CG_4_10_14_0_8_um_filter_66_14]PJB68923.1 MAG: hypothetical protein CO096_13915 [Armatimonadetes bacterium CG_4_9_14_3_um_filter_66_14]
MHTIIDDNMRAQLTELDPQPGDLVTVKYAGGAHSITVVGVFGKSLNAPYVVQSNGEHFALRPKVVFTKSEYEFSSIDVAIFTQRQQFVREVEQKGVKLPFELSTRANEHDPAAPKRYGGEASARMEARVRDALESAEDPRDALLDIRAKVRQRRGA